MSVAQPPRCEAPCDFYESETSQPCWGRVYVVGWQPGDPPVHACDGHQPAWQEDGYHAESYCHADPLDRVWSLAWT